MRAFLYPVGSRVSVQRGRFPMDPGLVGRLGRVIEVDDYRPGRYTVQLDGEPTLREFREDELRPES